MQVALVGKLHAHLSDVVGALVVRGLVPLLDAIDVTIVDPADVTDHVRGERSERILPEQPRLDLHAGEAVAVDGEARDFLVTQARAQRQAFEVPGLLQELLEPLAVARLHVDELRKGVDGVVQVAHPRGLDLERVGGVALGEDHAVAIGDHAAVGDDRHDGDPIGLGEGLVVIVARDLEIEEANGEAAEGDHDQHRGDRHPAAEQEDLALGIAQLGSREGARRLETAAMTARPESHGHAPHSSDAERRGCWGTCSTSEITGHSSAPTKGETA